MKKFSFKKLLLTILCSIVITTFIGTTYLFTTNISFVVEYEVISQFESDSQALKTIEEVYGRSFKETVNILKAQHGEDYPAEGIFSYGLRIQGYYELSQIYIFSVVIGTLVGSAFYIIVIQNAKGKKIILELLIALAVVLSVIFILNIGYEAFINKVINEYNTSEMVYKTEIYDTDNINTILIYVIAASIAYIGNLVYQKIQTNRLNKELNKNVKVEEK